MADELERIRLNLQKFIARETGAPAEVGPLERYPVGMSWETFGFEAEWSAAGSRLRRPLILRRAPEHGVLPPYSAQPQFLALRALEGHDLPVPRVYWASEDSEILGEPFFVMERLPGVAPLPWVGKGQMSLDEAVRPAVAAQFVSTLARLHSVPWENTPAAQLRGATAPEAVSRTEVEFWEGFLHRRQLQWFPLMEWALHWLKANLPEAPRVSIVHGDYRIGNFLVHESRLSAVLDWELVHLGDPHEDLGWVCMRPFRGRSPLMCHLMPREELYARYSEAAQLAVSDRAVRFYEVLGNFKLAAIHISAARAFEDGARDLRMAALAAQTPRMLLQLARALEEVRR